MSGVAEKAGYPRVGIYEHYKSTPRNKKYYQVLGFARHTETDEILVIYIPLYIAPDHIGLRLQARPLAMFLGDARHGDKIVSRFKYLGEELI